MKNADPAYTIGVVARRTNVHPETLRVWERRYQMVTPQRNLTGRRLYSEDDVTKLSLVKKLTDVGHSVSGLANLSIDDLQRRLSVSVPPTQHVKQPASQFCSVIICGESLGLRLMREKLLLADIDIVASVSRDQELAAAAKASPAEVLVSEFTTINHETLNTIRRQLANSHCSGAVIVFSFGTRSVIAQLEQAGMLCMKASFTAAELRRACLSLRPTPKEFVADSAMPALRRFNPQQLAQLSSISGDIACECPNHLADLVASLNAFEQYSSECANRNANDAELHAYLNQSAGHARVILENCLVKVMEIEGIKI